MTHGRAPLATEKEPLEVVIDGLPGRTEWARAISARLNAIKPLPSNARVLDIGAAAGAVVAAFRSLGYDCVGVEPWVHARRIAEDLGLHLGSPITVVDGSAERIPFGDGTFDVVHACSVIEHVVDVEKAFSEISRVLRPGGVFWFSSASSLCPVQHEIRGFPLFGWYPDGLKIRIMSWAAKHRPHLVGHTESPAVHWFTPRKARRLLRKHGFAAVYDRWDLRREDEGGRLQRTALKLIRRHRGLRLLADVCVPDCSYAAIKS